MYRVAVCDDNREFLELTEAKIRWYCLERQLKIVLECFVDSDTLAERIEERKGFDAYILDIEMPNLSGMELAEIIEQYSGDGYIIYLTSYEQYAVKACNVNVLNYVLKDQMENEFPAALNRLFDRLDRSRDEKTYIICNKRKYIKIAHRDIIYIYKDQKNAVFVLTGAGKEWDRSTLQEVYQKLDSADMYMLDRGIILNLSHVRKIVDGKIVMTDGYELTSSPNHINGLKEYLITHLGDLV